MPGPGTAPAAPGLSIPAPAPSAPPADAPAVAIPEGTSFRLVFAPRSSELPPDAAPLLDGLAARLNRSETARIQLRAYAAATPETAREARKLSLDRALAVRGHLVDRGVRSTRIDVRALGAATEAADGGAAGAPSDRIDILIVN